MFFMVMEYIEGETLASLLRQLRKHGEHLPLAAVLQVVADACAEYDQTRHEVALGTMGFAFSWLTSTDEVVQAWG